MIYPTNIQIEQNNFVRKLANNEVYVDKTDAILKLVQSRSVGWCEAPKGVGKTLLLDVIEAMFFHEYHLFRSTKVLPDVCNLPYATVLRIDGLLWSENSVYYLKRLKECIVSAKVVVLFDNFEEVNKNGNSGAEKNLADFIGVLRSNMKSVYFALFLSELGRLNSKSKQALMPLSRLETVVSNLALFQFSEQELRSNFSEELNRMAYELGVATSDIYQHLQQTMGASSHAGFSPAGVLKFLHE